MDLEDQLYSAIIHNNAAQVDSLIKAGVNVFAFNRDFLNHASVYGNYEIIKLLLNAGVVPDGNALLDAAHYGFRLIVKLLLDHGATTEGFEDFDWRWIADGPGGTAMVKFIKENED